MNSSSQNKKVPKISFLYMLATKGNRISGSFFVAAPDNRGEMKPAQVRKRKREARGAGVSVRARSGSGELCGATASPVRGTGERQKQGR